MKKLILAIIVAVSFQVANAQITPAEQNRQAVEFLKQRSIRFNKGQVPVRVDNFNGLTDSLAKAGINFSRTVYLFDGEQINSESCAGGSSESFTGKKAIPFIKFRIYKEGRTTYIEVVDGNSYI